jgi:hypothetical protein
MCVVDYHYPQWLPSNHQIELLNRMELRVEMHAGVDKLVAANDEVGLAAASPVPMDRGMTAPPSLRSVNAQSRGLVASDSK